MKEILDKEKRPAIPSIIIITDRLEKL